MVSTIKWVLLLSYWSILTQSLLMTCPWELFSHSLVEHPPFDISFEPISWLIHSTAYALLGFLICEVSYWRTKVLAGLFVLAFIHSAACESLQTLIPGRWPNLWDGFSNTLGLTSAFVLHKALRRFLARAFPWKIFPRTPAT